LIEFKNVIKQFGEKQVLRGISFTINEGEIVFVIGKSGIGKSVILKHIIGLMRPDSGEVWVEGQELSHFSERQLLAIRKRVGMVFQYPALLDSLTIFDNIAFGIRAMTPEKAEGLVHQAVKEKLGLLNLHSDVLARFPSELSYGMQKRVSLARTLVLNPSCLLFDEPTTGLDPVNTNTVNDLILRLSRALKVTSVVVSHDMHCALQIADRILLLDQGVVVADGTPADMVYSENQLAAQFMREAKEKIYGNQDRR